MVEGGRSGAVRVDSTVMILDGLVEKKKKKRRADIDKICSC